MSWRETHAARELSPDEAVRRIHRGKHIQISSGASVPTAMVEALGRNAKHFADNTIVHLMTFGEAPHVDPKFEGRFRHNAFFIGSNVRQAVHEGRADYTPVFLSRIPSLIRTRRMPVDVAIVQCSPPDEYGYVNLGVSVDISLAGIEAAKLVIAEINPNVPVVHGAGYLPLDRFDHWVWSDEPLKTHDAPPIDDVSMEIGRHVATLIEDRSTLQLGIGAIPDAVLLELGGKRDLGLWTEMFSDGILPLVENGVITGRYKSEHPGKITSSFCFGSQKLYDFVHQNPLFTFHPSDLVNDPVRIASQHQMVSVNWALEVDLTGQVCADSIGTRFFSGIGGQVDFVRGASMCRGGKPIIALPSTAKNGTLSRISATLTEGAGVVTSRGDVRFVVTEYGIADLLGKSIRERAMALISIAHPDFRGELLEAAKERHYVFQATHEPRGRYPRELEREVTAKNGKSCFLRALKPSDEQKVQDFFYGVSDQTVYKRFMQVLDKLSYDRLQDLIDVGYEDDLALVLEHTNGGQEPDIVAVAQYYRDKASNLAEVAFMVDDAWQRQGLGTELFRALAKMAESHGIRGFTAEVLTENRPMLHLFHSTGLVIKSSVRDGTYHLQMKFRKERI